MVLNKIYVTYRLLAKNNVLNIPLLLYIFLNSQNIAKIILGAFYNVVVLLDAISFFKQCCVSLKTKENINY